MWEIFLGAGTFAAVLGFTVSFLIKQKGFSYREEFYIFSPLFLLTVVFLIAVSPRIHPYLRMGNEALVLFLVAGSFVVVQHIYGRIFARVDIYGYDTIPEDTKQVLDLNIRTALSKICEITLQQMCALLIVVGLAMLGVSLFWMSILFTLVVFILHIPTPKWFGKIYGNYFLWASTLFAPFIPYLILTFPGGFYLSLSLHIFMYIVLYSFVYVKSSKKV